jgi:hypothetical protein
MARWIWLLVTTVTLGARADAPKKFQFDDFWGFAGITRTSTADDFIKQWGKPKVQREETNDGTTMTPKGMQFDGGPDVVFFRSGAIVDFAFDVKRFNKAHPGTPARLVGASCADAGAQLAFWNKPVPRFLSCTHFDSTGWSVFLVVTCVETMDAAMNKKPPTITKVTVTWTSPQKNFDPANPPKDVCKGM